MLFRSLQSNVTGDAIITVQFTAWGAGGDIMTMPGLPSVPAANSIKLNTKGEIEGLF